MIHVPSGIVLATPSTVHLLSQLRHHHHATIVLGQDSARERWLVWLLMLLGEARGCSRIRGAHLLCLATSVLTGVLLGRASRHVVRVDPSILREWEPVDCHFDDGAELFQLRLAKRALSLCAFGVRKFLILLLP